MALTKFVQKSTTKTGPTLVFDCHNLIFRVLFVAVSQSKKFHEDINETNYYYWKYLFVKSMITTIKQFSPKDVIMALDSTSWRKEIYPQYKANRKASRDSSLVDFDKFFPVLETFLQELQELLSNYCWLKVDRSEADDIMAILSKEITSNVILISTDRDLNQLLSLPNVKQYNPVEKKFVNLTNPEQALQIKCLTGDKGDNIPAIMPKCGPVKAAKFLSEGLITVTSNSILMANYTRNKQLIDFNFIPIDIQKSIKESYHKYSYKPIEGRKFFNFFVKHKMSSMLDEMTDFVDIVKNTSSKCESTNQEHMNKEHTI